MGRRPGRALWQGRHSVLLKQVADDVGTVLENFPNEIKGIVGLLSDLCKALGDALDVFQKWVKPALMAAFGDEVPSVLAEAVTFYTDVQLGLINSVIGTVSGLVSLADVDTLKGMAEMALSVAEDPTKLPGVLENMGKQFIAYDQLTGDHPGRGVGEAAGNIAQLFSPAGRPPRRAPSPRASGTAASCSRRDASPASRTFPVLAAASPFPPWTICQVPGPVTRGFRSSRRRGSPNRWSTLLLPRTPPRRHTLRGNLAAQAGHPEAGHLEAVRLILRGDGPSVRPTPGRAVPTVLLRSRPRRVLVSRRAFRSRRHRSHAPSSGDAPAPVAPHAPNHKAPQALTKLAANRHRSLARHRPSTRRRLRSLPGMAWPNRGPTATTHRTRAISQLRRATPEVRATGRMRPPTISLLPIRPRPNPPARTNRPGRTTASRTNQRTHRATQPMPGRTSRGNGAGGSHGRRYADGAARRGWSTQPVRQPG